jgi:hypothetical protein
VSDAMEKLVTLDILVPGELAVVYPGVDAWTQLDQGGASAPGSDPAWASIEHFAVTPGGTPKVMSVNASAQVDTAQSKFGGASAVFDGVGDYISTPDHSDFVLGSGDFTAECWVRFSDKTKTAAFMCQWDASGQMSWMTLWNGTNQLAMASSVNGSTNVGLGNWTWLPNNDQWYHVALVRSGTNILIYVDGVALGAAATLSGALFNSTAPLTIGGRTDVTTTTLAGWIDEARLSVGIARYTATFTPAAAPFTTDANTKLLLHCDGTDGSNTFTDDSPMPPTGVDPGADPAWLQLEA